MLGFFLLLYQKGREEIEEKEALLEKLQNCLKEAELKADKLKASFENLCGISVTVSVT